MTFYVTNQNYVVLWLFLVGVVIGIIYDIFRVKREVFGAGVVVYILDDLLFSFIYTVVFVFAIFLTNYGYVRWYEIAFALLGFLIYKSTVSNILVKVAVRVIRFILKILKTVIVVFLKPAVRLLSFVLYCFKRLYCVVLEKYQTAKVKNNSKKRLKREIILSRKGFNKT